MVCIFTMGGLSGNESLSFVWKELYNITTLNFQALHAGMYFPATPTTVCSAYEENVTINVSVHLLQQ